MDAIEILKTIEDTMARLDLIEAEREEIKRNLLGDLWYDLQEIDEEYEPRVAAIKAELNAAKKALAALAPQIGKNLSGEMVKAVLVKPRITITNPELFELMAERHPELKAIAKVSPPSYRIVRKR